MTESPLPTVSAKPEAPNTGSAGKELEARLARLEAQIHAQGERLAELADAVRSRKQQALMTRLVILVLALAAFFFLRSRAGV